jgi:phytoene synthase
MRRPWSESGFASPADLVACGALLRGGSRTFFAAARTLPRSVSEPATALYAFCRLADDAVDLHEGDGATQALAELRERLDRVYRGCPMPASADRAFADVVERFAIPRALPEALLEGFEWDAARRRYEDLADLKAYAARVAGAVGAMMAMLMGVRDADTAARACGLGVAMQLTNIARDVGEDARAGRLYLPLEWLREVGVDPDAWLARPVFNAELGSVIARLLRTADAHYADADVGIARLPLGVRPGMHAARRLYAEIGREVERRGLDSVCSRAVVPGTRKCWLLARAVAASALPVPCAAACSSLEQTAHLVDAMVAAQAGSAPTVAAPPWWKLSDRLVRLVELLEQIERRERDARSAQASARLRAAGEERWKVPA